MGLEVEEEWLRTRVQVASAVGPPCIQPLPIQLFETRLGHAFRQKYHAHFSSTTPSRSAADQGRARSLMIREHACCAIDFENASAICSRIESFRRSTVSGH